MVRFCCLVGFVCFFLFSLFFYLVFLKNKQAVSSSSRYVEMHAVLDKLLVSLCIFSMVNCYLWKKLCAASLYLHENVKGHLHEA